MTCPYCKTDNHPQAVKCAACGSGAGLGLLIYIAFWIAMPLEPAPAAMPAQPIVTPPPPAAPPRIEQPHAPQG